MDVTRINKITTPSSFPSAVAASRQKSTGDTITAMSRNTLAAVQSAHEEHRRSSQVGSALEKINGAVLLLSDPAAALETPATRALFERGQQALSEISRLGDKIHQRRTKLVKQKHEEIKAAEQQIEARKSAGFWGSLLNFFKTIATACTAAVSAITGNVLGLVGAGLAFSSMAASAAGSNELALGLGVAGGMFCVAGSIAAGGQAANQAAKQIAQRATKALKIAAGVSGGAAGVSATVKGSYDSDELEAQARRAELKASSKRLMQQITEDGDLVRELQRIVHQSSMKLATLLGAAHQEQLAAVAG